jgi:hypothetical protein
MVVGVVVALAGCEGAEQPETVSTAETWSVDPQPRLVVGADDAIEGHMLEGVVQAFKLGDALLIADGRAAEIRRFGSSGELEWRAGRRGEGPGEFNPWLRYLSRWSGDTIAAHDAGRRVHLFGADGDFVRTWRFPSVDNVEAYSGLLAGTRVFRVQKRAGIPRETGFSVDSTFFHLVDQADQRVATLGPFVDNPMHYVVGADTYSGSWVPFAPTVHYSVGPDLLWIGHGAAQEVFGVNAVGDTVSRFTLDWDAQPVSARDLTELEGEFTFELPAMKPIIGDVVTDNAGRVWVQRYHTPGSSESQKWSVFASDGSHLADTEIPGDVRVLSIGDGWLTGLWTGPLGIHHVRLYDVSEGM